MARKCYHRTFRKGGQSFMAQPVCRQDKKTADDVWYLEMVMDGRYRIVHDSWGNIPKFRTLKEAQSHAWSVAADPWLKDIVY